jgi:hypothetical protein
MTAPTIIECMDHPAIWAGWFRDKATWQPWRAFLAALFGLSLSEADLNLYRQCTGRTAPPAGGTTEAWLVVGRRGGKSFVLAMIACYLAVFRDYRRFLSPGELGCVKILATDRKQARTIHRYCRALLTKVPAFAQLIERETDDEILLTNSIIIEIQTASFRSSRSYTVIAALCDELAFWRSDESSANPDSEILRALRPAMATIPTAMLLAASSPYARRGELYRAFREHHGLEDSPALVWRAPTRVMNPSVPQSFIDRETERDPASAAAEYGAEFRTDIESYISPDVVESVTMLGRHEMPPTSGIVYQAFIDPSGGSGQDSMTLAICHRAKDGKAILDAVRERRPPFSPEAVTNEFASLLKSYRINKVTGDRFAGEWPRERLLTRGIRYEIAEHPKSQIYLEALPALNSGKVELLDHPRLASQLCGLERRTARGGKDSIDHAPGGHDDVANAALGALLLCATVRRQMKISDAMLRRAHQPGRYVSPRYGVVGHV